MAILYSFLPYHFARGEAHLLLSGYFMVPIATLLILQVLSDDPPFTGAPRIARASVASRAVGPAGGAVAPCVRGPGLDGAVLRVLRGLAPGRRRRRRLRGAAELAAGRVRRRWPPASSSSCCLLNLSPSFLYWAVHGQNDQAIPRGVSETEVNGLRVAELVLPRVDHRIGAFADAQRKSDRFSPVATSERGQQLGLVGAVGFVGLLVFTLSRLLRRRSNSENRGPPPLGTRTDIGKRLGLLTVVAVIVATVSGFSLLISALGVRYIRSYNRISVFIAFFALVAVAFALDWIVARLPRWHGRAVVAGVVCVAVLAVGVADQTSSADVPDYKALERAWDSDDVFMHGIQRDLGSGAAVFQLPYVFFPEAGTIVGTGPYDQVRGWLHADSLRWSWGSVRGRDGDWQGAVVRLPAPGGARRAHRRRLHRAHDRPRRLRRSRRRHRGGVHAHPRPGTASEPGRPAVVLRPPAVGPRPARAAHEGEIDALRRTTLAARAPPPGALT